MPAYHIAQMNVLTFLYDPDDARLTDFMAALDPINALADDAPGFVWRLQTESGNATEIQVTDDPRFIVNMSVWESVEALFDFVYRTAHAKVMARRREWAVRPDEAHQVLWWVPTGHRPTVEEGMARLERLRREGPGPAAFTFKAKFPPPGEGGSAEDMEPEPYCAGWTAAA